jgi:hypothetical protein
MRSQPFLILCSLFISLVAHPANGQTKYWVFFKDKDTSVKFNPGAYFSAEALERRAIQHIGEYDYTDLPVNIKYVEIVSQMADSAGNVSRWFNGMGVWASATEINKIAALQFVSSVQLMNLHPQTAETRKISDEEEKYLEWQISRLEGEKFQDKKITGSGIRIAVFDVGFKNANKHPAFKRLFDSGQILQTYNFIKKKTEVYDYGNHGTEVFSCLAGNNNGKEMGMAPGAKYLLARTERNNVEWLDEEDNWVAAAEWADKLGAQIISCSLGYTYKRYFNNDMNGKTSLVARAATMAVRKGIIVVTAAGNDGNDWWKYICTPGDADSVITVGGVDPATNLHINFSSFGPTSDGRLKPDITAPGAALVALPDGNYGIAQGTSFSTPLMAGFVACVLQLHPEYTPAKMLESIRKSATLYPYFDYAHGYGLPQAGYFIGKTDKRDTAKTFKISVPGDSLYVDVEETAEQAGNNDDTSAMSVIPAQINEENTALPHYLYYKVMDSVGRIVRYAVVKVYGRRALELPIDDLPLNGTISIHYDNYTEENFYY